MYTFAFPTARPAIGDALTAQQIKQTNLGAVGQFWAGVCIGTLPRLEAIPGRKFYDFDGITEKDPVKILGDAGVNALRVVTDRSQCLGPTQFVNNASTHDFEMNYELEFGCIDTKVKLAQRGVAQGMRVVHTINQGRRIPRELEHLNYAQMIDNVQAEARRQLQPFLDANVLPDIILLENEGTDGFLFEEASTGHFRGIKDDKASTSQIDQELCGHVPTGNINSYPQYAGYLKAEIMACNAVISTAGYDTDTVRYGLHSHAQYVQWKEGIVRGPDGPSEQVLQDSENRVCPAKEAPHVVPEDLLVQSVSQMLTIAGFSAYPDPQTPTNIDSDVARKATLDRLTNTLTQIQGYAEAIGTFDSGPFKGQYKLQSLGVEYATSFEEEEVPQEQALTELMWRTVKEFDSLLGIFWWEPWSVELLFLNLFYIPCVHCVHVHLEKFFSFLDL